MKPATMKECLGIAFSIFLAVMVLVLFYSKAWGQELKVLTGVTIYKGEVSFAEQAEYYQPFNKWMGFSIAYLNEGHFEGHHRDGIAGQAWIKKSFFSVGIGGYLFFDTRTGQENAHGITPLFSISGDFPLSDRLSLTARANYALKDNITLFMAGLSYTPEQSHVAKSDSELNPMFGFSLPNGSEGQNELVGSLEYRWRATENIDWTLSLINKDVASQLWMVKRFDNASFGFGAGLIAGDQTNVLLSMTGNYKIFRFIWDRRITADNQDKDYFRVGVDVLELFK